MSYLQQGHEMEELMKVYNSSLKKQQKMHFSQTVSLPRGPSFQTMSCLAEGSMGMIPVKACWDDGEP